MSNHQVCTKRWIGELCRWARDMRGNVSIIFGLAIVPLMVAMGMAIDLTNQVRADARLSGVADAVALAAAQLDDGTEEQRIALAQRFLAANSSDGMGDGVTITAVDIAYDDENNRVTVELTAAVPTSLMGIIGINHTTAQARSVTGLEATAGIPVSLALVLDVSGSMDWDDKIGDLRTAATRLLDKLEEADTTDDRLRTGLVTYSTGIRTVVDMDWGIGHTRPVVASLTAWGGTASTEAVNRARAWLISQDENQRHIHMSGQDPLKFIIFMTDGDNNDRRDDRFTERLCDQIKRHDVQIYSVAFQAPRRGRQLLRYCADDADHYFDADNSQEFLDAFDIILERIQTSMLRIVE